MNGNESITNYMTRKLITFHPDTDIWDALQMIVKNKISGAPVVDKSGNLVGMLSEVDCIRVILEGPYNNQPGGHGIVKDYMNHGVSTIEVNTTLMEAAFSFAHSKYKRFPVLDGGKLVGQLSRSDVLRAISKYRKTEKIVPDSWKARVPMAQYSRKHNG